LEAWISPQRKQELGLVSWSADCPQLNVVGSIKLMGLNRGSRLRTAPGKQNVIVTLDAVGGSGQHYWLLDGKQTENANGKKRQSFIINTAGAHSITVIDAAGHVDSVGFVVDKRD
jgi:penicillin-binding protein 1C